MVTSAAGPSRVGAARVSLLMTVFIPTSGSVNAGVAEHGMDHGFRDRIRLDRISISDPRI